MRYWLFKTEPGAFSIEDLEAAAGQTTCWDGVRNFQARNFMRDDMRPGDRAFLYHSSCNPAGIVGEIEVVRAGYPDHTAFDSKDKHYDPDSDPAAPKWFMVDIKLRKKFTCMISLAELRNHAKELEDLLLLRKGNRLSVLPVSASSWKFINRLQRK